MIAGLFLAAAALSGQEVYGPAAPAPPKPAAAPAKTSEAECPPAPKTLPDEIVVCAPKPEGYRIDPDVLAAKKMKREAMRGRPQTLQEKMQDTSCSVVGPAGCLFAQPGINLLGALTTMSEMADRLSKGQEIGSMFVTEPELTEYQYYQVAKKEREDKEALTAAKAKAAAVKASAPAKPDSAAPAPAPAPATATPATSLPPSP